MAEIIEPKIKELPAWTLEDFESAVPHNWLYSNYYMNPFTYRRALVKIDESARKIGYPGFKAEMRDYTNTTEFAGQPIELNCGKYICTDTGVSIPSLGEVTTICPHPILISGRLVNLDSGEVRLEVSFKRSAEWRTVVVEKIILASAAKIIDLARLGIAVDSENAKALVKYFTDLEAWNYDRLPERHSVARVGWTTSGKFVPYADSVEFDGAPGFRAVFDSFHPNGDRDAWFKAASKARNESTIARIVLAASLASALVNPLHALPFFVHVWGRSGNSAPLCVDELQVVKNRRDYDDIIYMLSEGQGRSRGSKDGSFQQLKSWQNTIITTGEMPITSDYSGAGAISRIIEISCGKERLLSDYRGLSDTLSHNWGFAGKEFIEGLTPQVLETAKKVHKEYADAIEKSDTTGKLAGSAALILVADALAELLIWHTGTQLSATDLAKYLPTEKEVDTNQRALEWLYGTIAENEGKFDFSGDSIPREVWGEYKTDGYDRPGVAIIASVLSRIMPEAGFNATAFRQWAATEGYLRRDAEGRSTFMVRLHGKPPTRCVWLYLGDK